uniref:Mastermind-like protein 2 n=2 Tax=Castor canadensis TaxID=51338 RepID=A0A8B7WIG8_CASCN|nr:mastermind-like protein 2 [Castor canadensis]
MPSPSLRRPQHRHVRSVDLHAGTLSPPLTWHLTTKWQGAVQWLSQPLSNGPAADVQFAAVVVTACTHSEAAGPRVTVKTRPARRALWEAAGNRAPWAVDHGQPPSSVRTRLCARAVTCGRSGGRAARCPLSSRPGDRVEMPKQRPLAAAGQHRRRSTVWGAQNPGPSPSPNSCSNPNPGVGFLNSQQSLLNQQLMGKKQTLQRQATERKQQLLLQQQRLADTEKIAPQDQINRHLTRLPPDYKDQRRNVGSLQPAAQYSGGPSTVSLNSNQALTNPVSTHTILTSNSSLMSTSQGTKMPSLSTAVQNIGMYGNLPCNQPGTFNVTSGMNQLTRQRNPSQLITNQNSPLMPRPPTLGPNNNNNVTTFGAGAIGSSPQLRPNLTHNMAGVPAQRTPNIMITSNTIAPNWASQEVTTKQQEALKSTGVRFPTGAPAAYTPNQPLQQTVGSQQFSQRAAAPPNQLTPAVQMRPMNQMNQTLNGQTMGPLRGLNLRPNQISTQMLSNLNPSGAGLSQSRTGISQTTSLTPNNFPSSTQGSRAFQGADQGSDLAFDFLSPQTDNMGPSLNSDADFIDSLLKTEPGNDDWMKDINLDEILGSNS